MPAPRAARRTPAVSRAAAYAACGAACVAFGALGACAGVAALANGAGGVMRPVPVAASGLEVPEQTRRDALAAGRWDTTRVATGANAEERGGPADDAPGDDLLRDLNRGTAAYYAGRWRASVAAFARAAALADDRETKRVSRGALALASNDRALPYVTGQNERLFVHYYAALAYLRAGAAEDAAVEARRMSLLLQRYEDGRDTLDLGARAALRYVAGAVFEAAGAGNDADVAYRNAAALGAGSDARPLTPPPGTPTPGAPATGDVVVVVERGFVAHRVGERLRVWTTHRGDAFTSLDTLRDHIALALHGTDALWADRPAPELRLITPDDTAPPTPDADPPARGPRTAAMPVTPPPARTPVGGPAGGPVGGASAIARRTAERPTAEQPRERPFERPRERRDEADEDRRWRLFTLAWPAYRRPVPLPPLGGVVVDAPAADTGAAAAGRAAVPPLLRGDLSLAIAADFKRDRAARLARLVARAALRASLVHRVDRTDRSLGDLAAALGRVVERADTRSWHLLPADVQVVRLQLPPGRHALALDVGGGQVALGTVRVQPRTVQVVSARVWDRAGARVTTAGFLPATP